jgi:hypothetical protein
MTVDGYVIRGIGEDEIDQGPQLDRQQVLIPAGIRRQFVVGDYIGPALGFRPVILLACPVS